MCGANSRTSSGGGICECVGANRFFQKSTGSCVCRRQFLYMENGVDLSDQDGAGNCQQQIYPCEGKNMLLHPSGEGCLSSEELCRLQCPKSSSTYLPDQQKCECGKIQPLNQSICDQNCRESKPKAWIRGDKLVFTAAGDPVTPTSSFSLEKLTARSRGLLAGSVPTCTDAEDPLLGCEVAFFKISKSGTVGYFAPPSWLEKTLTEALSKSKSSPFVSSSSSLSRLSHSHTQEAKEREDQESDMSQRRNAAVAPAEGDVLRGVDVSVSDPVRCLRSGSTVMWILSQEGSSSPSSSSSSGGDESFSSSPVFPSYLKNVAINSRSSFDYGTFARLRVDILSGYSWLLFSYTFDTPGVYTFGSVETPWSHMILKVVDASRNETCPSFTDFPQPPSKKLFDLLDISVRDTLTYRPHWLAVFTLTLLLFLFIFFLTSVLLRSFRKAFWVYPEADKLKLQGKKHDPETSMFKTLFNCLAWAKKAESLREEEKEVVPQDFDPRVFHAIYAELLQLLNCISNGLSDISKQRSRRHDLVKNRQISLSYTLGGFLRRIRDQTEELASAHHSTYRKLGTSAALLLLRRDRLNNLVRDACLAETNSHFDTSAQEKSRKAKKGQNGHSGSSRVRFEVSMDKEEAELPDVSVNSLPSAMIAPNLKEAIQDLAIRLQTEKSEETKRSLINRFKEEEISQLKNEEAVYGRILKSLSADSIGDLASQVQLDLQVYRRHEAFFSRQFESLQKRSSLFLHTGDILGKALAAHDELRRNSTGAAYLSVVGLYTSLSPLLLFATYERRGHLQKECQKFQEEVSSIVQGLVKTIEDHRSSLASYVAKETRQLTKQLHQLLEEDFQCLEESLENLEKEERETLEQQYTLEACKINRIYKEYTTYIDTRYTA
ncbi:gcc2 and gcc3 domain protein, partial [Cystoisospora suis]